MEHRISRCKGTLQLTVHVGQVLERVQDHQHGGQERHEATHRGAVLLRLIERQRDHQRHRHRRHHLRDGHQQRRSHRHPSCKPLQLPAGRCETAALVLLPCIDLDDRVAMDGLAHHAGELTRVAQLLARQPPHAARKRTNRQRHHRDQHEGDHRELPVQVQQPAQQAQDHAGVAHHDHQHRGQRLRDVLHVVDQPRNDGARRMGREIAHRHLHQTVEHLLAQVVQHRVRHLVHRVVHGEREHATPHEEPDDHQRRRPHQLRIALAAETVVQQVLHDGGQRRLGRAGQHHRHHPQREHPPVRPHVTEQPRQQHPLAGGLPDGGILCRFGRRLRARLVRAGCLDGGLVRPVCLFLVLRQISSAHR